jgi:hypothetical protein
MAATFQLALLLVAVACFIAAALRAPLKWDLLAVGLACWAFAEVMGHRWGGG